MSYLLYLIIDYPTLDGELVSDDELEVTAGVPEGAAGVPVAPEAAVARPAGADVMSCFSGVRDQLTWNLIV
ncbi:MAG: hypothetical protein KH901_09225, partial [Streptococcus vestibularis]|nr:hypothetical protein [Streptococcus vestibularis]